MLTVFAILCGLVAFSLPFLFISSGSAGSASEFNIMLEALLAHRRLKSEREICLLEVRLTHQENVERIQMDTFKGG